MEKLSHLINSVINAVVGLFVVVVLAYMVWGCAPYGAGYSATTGYGYAAPVPAMGGGYYAGAAPVCKAPTGTLLEIDNDSDYLIEVVSNQVEKLPCNAGLSHVPAMVQRPNGQIVQTLVIPPHARAKYQFLALEGVRVTYVAYINYGPSAPARAFKYKQNPYEPMQFPMGVHQDILNGDLHPLPTL